LRLLASAFAALLVSSVGALVFAAPPEDDSTRNAARSLAEQGRDAFERGDFERSRDLFRRAQELVQAPTLALYEARSLVRLGRLVEAQESYLRAIRAPLEATSPEAFRKAVREAELDEQQLAPRLPKVTIVVSGTGATAPGLVVNLDERRLQPALVGVEMPLDPGRHLLQAELPGGQPSRVEFTIAEREQQTVEVRVDLPPRQPTKAVLAPPRPAVREAPRPSPSTWHRPAAFVAGGVGVAGLATGVVAGLVAASKHRDAERQCPNLTCVQGSAGEDSLNEFRSLRTVSTLGYVVGGLGVAAGVTFFLIAPSRRDDGHVAIWLGARSAGLSGAF
jgi:hypothetical protein